MRSTDYSYDNQVELVHLDLDRDDKGYFLRAKFKIENAHNIREIEVGKIRFPIDKNKLRLIVGDDGRWGCRDSVFYHESWIDFGFGRMPLETSLLDGVPALYTEKLIEEKYTEMTLDEIEKKLGHKIKIVNK